MKEYMIITKYESERKKTTMDESEVINSICNSSIKCDISEHYDELNSPYMICDIKTGEIIFEFTEDEYSYFQEEVKQHCSRKYRRCA